MKRLLRYVLLLLSILCVLLCAATIWLWVRGHEGPESINYTSKNQWCVSIISGHGTIDICVIPDWKQDPDFYYTRYPPNVWYGTRYSYKNRFLGFGRGEQWPEYGGWYVNIPNWFIAAITAGGVLLLARMWWKRRPRPAGRCRRCGYDLRATPDRCPECGTPGRFSSARPQLPRLN
jgi:hypothetical protein